MPKEQCCFIEKLYQAVQEQRPTIVDWDPSGKGFIVCNLNEFTSQVLLRRFGIGRLDSFARKLNRHGFKRSKIDRNKIRFFHKHFHRQSKNLSKIKKLSKYESLPKHIKLRMIRQQLSTKSSGIMARQSDLINEIFQTVKIGQSQINEKQSQNMSGKSQDNDMRNSDQKEGGEQQLDEDIKIEPIMNYRLGIVRTPQYKNFTINDDIDGVNGFNQCFPEGSYGESVGNL